MFSIVLYVISNFLNKKRQKIFLKPFNFSKMSSNHGWMLNVGF